MKFFKKLKIDFFLVFLILIAHFLCYKNYTSNTFLSGWDTLHPEFNLSLYWQRITSVWQEHQNLGAPLSQSHSSEITRMPFLIISSLLFFPTFVRYSYFFLMIILGSIGIYLLLRYIFNCFLDNRQIKISKVASFLGGLFYLLNLGTVQHFIVPLEMFATKFGFLPFLYLFAIKFLNEGKRNNLIIFSFLTIFASSMAHTATLWYVYFGGLVLFNLSYVLLKKSKNHLRKSFILIIFTLVLNLYWIAANLYYYFNYGKEVVNSKIHRLGSEEFYHYNKKYGDISDFLLFKNFLFDWYIINNKIENQPLLIYWNQHLKNPFILSVGYFLSFVSLMGIVFIILKKNFLLLSFLPIALFYSFFLLSNVPGVSFISNWIININPIIKEIFRFPFTKFSIYIIFCFSLFFAYFHKVILNKLMTLSIIKNKKISIFFVSFYMFFFFFFIFVFNLPAFQGNFISPIVRVKIPQDYFSLFNWSKNQDQGRILLLPIYGPYGWTIYKWNLPLNSQVYQGAGFTWFGLSQPSLNSEFNRWYPYNEQSFREFFYAIYSQNSDLLKKLLEKYNIRYLLLDENVIVPGESEDSKKLFYPQIKELLTQISSIRFIKKFGEKITLFEYFPSQKIKPVKIYTNYNIVNPSYKWNYIDESYQNLGFYISTDSLKSDKPLFIFPGRDLLTKEEKINKEILKIGKDHYQITFPKSLFLEKGQVKIPNLNKTESVFFGEVYVKKINNQKIAEIKYLLPYLGTDKYYRKEFIIDDDRLDFFAINDKVFFFPEGDFSSPVFLGEVNLSTRKENSLNYYSRKESSNLSSDFFFTPKPYLCSSTLENLVFGAEMVNRDLKIYGQNGKICVDIPLQEMIKIDKDGAIKISFYYQIKTLGLNKETEFCFFDQYENKCLLKKDLQSFFASKIDFIAPIEIERLRSYYLKFSFDTRRFDQINELLIKNFNFNFYEKEKEIKFIPEIPSFNLITQEFKILGKFPKEKIEISPRTIGVQKNDCSFEKAVLIDKQFIETNSGMALEYKAIDGSICESIFLPNVSQNFGYLLAIESQNFSGFPLKICLEDQESKICHLEEKLSKNKNFDFDYFIIPPYNQKNNYRLFINNYSIGDTPTINRIRAIRFIPFPYNFFQAIRWESNKETGNYEERIDQLTTKKLSPFIYLVKIKKESLNNSILVLDQAYEKNWKAYQINHQFLISSFKFLFNYFPFFFGQELKDHVLVNNWANGWFLDQSQISGSESQIELIIVFLPQYLQFFGFLLMILIFIYILRIKTGKF